MDSFDKINENEIRVIGEATRPANRNKRRQWPYILAMALGIALLIALALLLRHREQQPVVETPTVLVEIDKTVPHAYVEVEDTIVADISLHRFLPINARPHLVMGLIKDIPDAAVLGAMAADFFEERGTYRLAGAFVLAGEMLSHSKSKYGFCAITGDTLVIGNALSTAYFEQAIAEKGDFFRQYALVAAGEAVKNINTTTALRRALCRLNDGRLCVIDTDMAVTLDSFAAALVEYGVEDAVALMGGGAAVRWATDEQGHRFIAGADEYEFPDVVNYLVWEAVEGAGE